MQLAGDANNFVNAKSHAREKPLVIMHTECIIFKQEPVSVKQGSREYDHSWQLY